MGDHKTTIGGYDFVHDAAKPWVGDVLVKPPPPGSLFVAPVSVLAEFVDMVRKEAAAWGVPVAPTKPAHTRMEAVAAEWVRFKRDGDDALQAAMRDMLPVLVAELEVLANDAAILRVARLESGR